MLPVFLNYKDWGRDFSWMGVFLSVATEKTVPAKEGDAYYTNVQGTTLTREMTKEEIKKYSRWLVYEFTNTNN